MILILENPKRYIKRTKDEIIDDDFGFLLGTKKSINFLSH